jgi:hypothetical protein
MKTLNNFLTTISQFFNSSNSKKIVDIEDLSHFEFTYPKFGLNLKQTSEKGKVHNSLFHQMYAQDNEILFI